MTRFTMTRFRTLAAATTLGVAAFATASFAQAPDAAGKTPMSLSDIEALLSQRGIRVEEMEVESNVVEIEGRNAENREVDLIIDRYTGEVLSERLDD